MKPLLLTLAIALLSPLAVAQTSQSQSGPAQSEPSSSPSGTEPSSSMKDPSTDGTANYSGGSDDDKLQMKACVAKERKADPQVSEDELKRKCGKTKPKD